MKAMVLEKQSDITLNPLRLVDRKIPAPSGDEVLIKVNTCGLCHTDLHVVEGELELKRIPIIPGHQIVGRIEAIGEMVEKWRVGDRIGAGWLYSTCGNCKYCKKGLENLCENSEFTGYSRDGGYAEYVIIKSDFAFKIPDTIPDVEASPLLCAGIIGFRSFKLSDIKEGENLGLFGFGASAHIVLQIAGYYNCRVFVFTRSDEHKNLAINMGALWTGSADDKPPAELDSAIIFAPVGSLYIKALEKLRSGGTAVSANIHMSDIPQFPYGLLYYEKTMKSVANFTKSDGEEFLKLSETIPIRTKTEVFKLSEANKALNLLKKGQITGAGVLIISD